MYTLRIGHLNEFLLDFYQSKLGVEESYVKLIVNDHVTPFISELKDDLWMVIEFPYVDKMYRNTFYHFYASKLKPYSREALRISLFSGAVNESEFRQKEIVEQLRKKYLGFLVIRPTIPKVIGRNAISPLAFKKHQFRCCIAHIPATVNALKFSACAFPHSSQDGQMITCAETTIWSLMEYFGNRYAEYKPILPSEIHDIIRRYSYKRQMPSDGLTAEQIAYTVREVGFGAMFYSKSKHGELFNGALSMFVESGIPVTGVIKGTNLAHAVNIIGKGTEDRKAIIANATFEDDTADIPIVDYNKIARQYVFIDDNLPPYRLADLENPCAHYMQETWKECKLTNLIVPLYHRIYLDPLRARRNFMAVIKSGELLPFDVTARIMRIFLASSRSYKEYIALNDEMPEEVKQLIIVIPMPKFVWVAELSTFETFEKQLVTDILIQDATEPIDYSAPSNLTDLSVFCGLGKGKFYTNISGKYEIIDIFTKPFKAYEGNLVNFES